MERKHRTSVFVLEVQEELELYEDSNCNYILFCSGHFFDSFLLVKLARLRRWFPVEEALRLLAIHKPVQCPYVNLLIQTSPVQCRIPLSHFSLASNSLPIFSQNVEPSNATPCPCKSSLNDTSSPSHYTQMNHYSNKDDINTNNNNKNSNANFHNFICKNCDVYSSDSEVAKDDSSNVMNSSNHYSPDVITTDVLSIETVCDNSESTTMMSNSECSKKSELLSLAKSSINS